MEIAKIRLTGNALAVEGPHSRSRETISGGLFGWMAEIAVNVRDTHGLLAG